MNDFKEKRTDVIHKQIRQSLRTLHGKIQQQKHLIQQMSERFMRLHEKERDLRKMLELFDKKEKVEQQQEVQHQDIEATQNWIIQNIIETSLLLEIRPQIISIEIFLDTNDLEKIDSVYKGITNILDALNLEIFSDMGDVLCSWFRRLFTISKKAHTQLEIQRLLDEIGHGLETHFISRKQASIDKSQAEGTARILESLDNISNAAIKIGSLLIVKVTDTEGHASVSVKSLSIP